MKHLIYLFITIAAFVFTACEKDSYHYVQSEPLTPEEHFDRMEKPLVLFHFAQRHLETGTESGWIIDREGWVRTYQKIFAPNVVPSADHLVLAELELERLYGAGSEGIFQIGKAELFEYLKQSRGLNQNQLSNVSAQPEEPMLQSFFAYTQRTSHVSTGNGGCNYGDPAYVKITQIHRSIVDMQGHQNRYNTSAKGEAVHQWLLDLDGQIQLPELDQ